MSQDFSEKTLQLKSLQDKLDHFLPQYFKTNNPEERRQLQKTILEIRIEIAKIWRNYRHE